MIWPLMMGAAAGLLLCLIASMVELVITRGATIVMIDAMPLFLVGGAVGLWLWCQTREA